MIYALSETGQAAAGSGGAALVVLVVLFLIWTNSDKTKAARTERVKRKQEIEQLLRSRPAEDRPIFREVLDALDAEDPKEKRP